MAIKNFWSLNVDEAIIADKLQKELKEVGYEVFFPLRSHLKDIDLLLYNLKNKRTYTLQIKGSRTYRPQIKDVEKFGEGQNCWIQISHEHIFNPENHIDFYIFVIHLEKQGQTKREIEINFLILPIKKFRSLIKSNNKKLEKTNLYKFYIWVNPKDKRAFDVYERNNIIDYTEYLNAWNLLK